MKTVQVHLNYWDDFRLLRSKEHRKKSAVLGRLGRVRTESLEHFIRTFPGHCCNFPGQVGISFFP